MKYLLKRFFVLCSHATFDMYNAIEEGVGSLRSHDDDILPEPRSPQVSHDVPLTGCALDFWPCQQRLPARP